MEPFEVSAGLETTIADPFVVRRGLRVGAAVRPRSWLGARVAVGGYPDLGERDYTDTTRLMRSLGIVPDLSRIVAQGLAGAEVTPLSSRGDQGFALRLSLSGGAVATDDDLELFGNELAPLAQAHDREVHPQWAWGASTESTFGDVGVRARIEQTRYTEQNGGASERKAELWLGVEGFCVLPRR